MQVRLEEGHRRIAELNQTIQDLHTDQQRLREVVLSIQTSKLPDIATSINELTRSLTELDFSKQGSEKSHGVMCYPSTDT